MIEYTGRAASSRRNAVFEGFCILVEETGRETGVNHLVCALVVQQWIQRAWGRRAECRFGTVVRCNAKRALKGAVTACSDYRVQINTTATNVHCMLFGVECLPYERGVTACR